MNWGTLLTGSTGGLVDLAVFIGRVAIGVCFVFTRWASSGWSGRATWPASPSGCAASVFRARGCRRASPCSRSSAAARLLALGLFTRPACVVLIGTMAVAGLLGHKGAGYLITNNPPGAEYTINLAVVCFMFLLTGPGALSLDRLLF